MYYNMVRERVLPTLSKFCGLVVEVRSGGPGIKPNLWNYNLTHFISIL